LDDQPTTNKTLERVEMLNDDVDDVDVVVLLLLPN
jgi:hypothetical protein